MHVVGGATVSTQEEQIQLEDQPPQEQQQNSHAHTSHTSELDDNGNNGSSQDVEETQEDGDEKGNGEEEAARRNNVVGCQIIQNMYYTESEPQDEDGASSDGNKNFSDENSRCKPTEWDRSFGSNRLSVVNRGGVDGVLRQGHQERLHLKWHIEQPVSTRDWISLCDLDYSNKMEKQSKGNWLKENMKEAIQMVMEGKSSIRQAASQFSVPRSTLVDRIKLIKSGAEVCMTPQMGRFKRTFPDDIEAQLVQHLKDLDSRLMPMNKKEFLRFTFSLAEQLKIPHQFSKDKRTAGEKFYYEFMSRHPEFSLRNAQSTSLQRTVGFNKAAVDLFFSKYENLMTTYNFEPSKIFNCDETGISVVHENASKVLAVKGKKQVSKITSGERGKNITILLSINATGDLFLPPLVVFPRKRMTEELKKDAPEGTIFFPEESGWITAVGFLTWLKMFVARVSPSKEEPALLILDGHSSHKDLKVVLYAKENHVHMISLPPHTTHKLQPLDRAVMRPFKASYNDACSAWLRKYAPMKITMKDVSGLLAVAFRSICRMDLARSAFNCTGLYPFNKNIFTDLDFVAASFFSADTAQEAQTLDETLPQTSSSAAAASPMLKRTVTAELEDFPRYNTSPSTSRIGMPTTSNEFKRIVKQISPPADMSNKKIMMRKRRSENSEILTSTPYKTMLEEKEERKKEKNKVGQNGRKPEEAKPAERATKTRKCNVTANDEKNSSVKDTHTYKRMLKFESNGPKEMQRESDGGRSECIICRETTDEAWVQCISCKGWAHIECADQQNIEFYKCDHCV